MIAVAMIYKKGRRDAAEVGCERRGKGVRSVRRELWQRVGGGTPLELELKGRNEDNVSEGGYWVDSGG